MVRDASSFSEPFWSVLFSGAVPSAHHINNIAGIIVSIATIIFLSNKYITIPFYIISAVRFPALLPPADDILYHSLLDHSTPNAELQVIPVKDCIFRKI